MQNREIPTQLDFEIINITPIDKYISECEIKVFYYGKNRNRSYISKAVGNQIANSLPRTPIVALYNERTEDYEDHAEEIIINKSGVKFIKKTIPYGAVSENAPIVWKKFIDDRGIEREYLVAKGYLWTGRYPHLQKVIDNPKGQSMEFFEESVIGNWAKFDNDNEEFFIFNEADISALCILGDDVEPCFEDSTIGRPEILYSLKKNEFKQEFNNFMLELNKVLDHNSAEGGVAVKIENENKLAIEEVEDVDVLGPETEFNKSIAEQTAELQARLDAEAEEAKEEDLEAETEEVEEVLETEAQEEEEVLEVEVDIDEEVLETESEIDLPEVEVEVSAEFVELQEKHSLLETELNDLKVKFALLLDEKVERELVEKEEICNKFSILGQDTLKQFRESLNSYTAQELEKELSVVAFNKGITFNLLTQKDGIVTPVPNKVNKTLPAWLQAIENKENAQ